MSRNLRFITSMMVVVVFIFQGCTSVEKVGIVDIKQVFEGFDYTNELRSELEATTMKQKGVLDSLRLDINFLMSKKQQGEEVSEGLLQEKQREYMELMESFETSSVNLTQVYDERILNQLNTYINQFGEENGYDMILGSNETGNIMYRKESYDVTDAVIVYINKKFKGE